jgi:hypothetical protein
MHIDQISDRFKSLSDGLTLSDPISALSNQPTLSEPIKSLSDRPKSHFNGAVIGYLILSTAVAFWGSVIGMLGLAFGALGGSGKAAVGFPILIMLGVFLINLGAAQLSRKLFKSAGFPDHAACAISMAVMGTVFGPIVYFVLICIASFLPH